MNGLRRLLAWWGVAALLGCAATATADQVDPSPERATRLHSAAFCETPAPFETAGCTWQAVTLPHRWQPQGPPGQAAWALYRLTWSAPAQGAFGVLTDHLSLHGLARSGEETLPPPGSRPAGTAHLRYWPQLFVFAGVGRSSGEPATVDLAVRGHPQAKNGLGGVVFAPLQAAQAMHQREVLLEVVLVLALAAASTMAGLVGLFAGDHHSLPERLLRLVSLLAIVAGVRTAMNFVSEPWLPWPAWHATGLWLLAAIGVLTAASVLTYLRPRDARLLPALAAGLALVAALLVLTPATWRFRLSETVFAVLVLLNGVLVPVLGWRAMRARETLGLTLFLPLLLVLLGGAHDLALHLGSGSLSDRYLQKWSTPGLLVLLVVLLGRNAASQRKVERALQEETARRQELLRDLHDGIGSRLVALAYHARQKSAQGPFAQEFAEEIDRLMHELRLIQGAVRADATTLEALVAELRHFYARVGGGNLPLIWEVSDLHVPCPLTAEQAVATARIVEEAVANAVKHANARRIAVTLGPGPTPWAAHLAIADDGEGRFDEGAGAGLRHMRLRAERAGLGLALEQSDGADTVKAVRLGFPQAPTRRRWAPWSRLRRGISVPR